LLKRKAFTFQMRTVESTAGSASAAKMFFGEKNSVPAASPVVLRNSRLVFITNLTPRQELPITIPTINTQTPPTITWKAARRNGVSM
jgi:hypothetical protein